MTKPIRGTKRRPPRRFSVSLERSVYDRLQALGRGHRPPLTLQYLTEYAVYLLLERSEDSEFTRTMGDPLRSKVADAAK